MKRLLWLGLLCLLPHTLRAEVDRQHPVEIAFTGPGAGALAVDGEVYRSRATISLKEGRHSFRILPDAGFALKELRFDDAPLQTSDEFELDVAGRLSLELVFAPAKRVRLSTYPAGLQLLLDRIELTPRLKLTSLLEPLDPAAASACEGRNDRPGHLCPGEFDLIPGSLHRVSAGPQTGPDGHLWRFDHLTMGSGGQFVIPADVETTLEIQAIFVRAD